MIIKYNSIYISLFLLGIFTSAQVGVQTENPRSEVQLDVNGKTNVLHHINLGGTNLSQPGSSGADKQIITSAGPTSSTVWGNKKIPGGLGETVTMTYMNTWYDNTGVDLAANGTSGYSESNTLNDSGTNCTAGNCWKVITGLNQSLVVYKPENKVNFIFQTTAQIGNNSGGIATFACGLFMNTPANPNVYSLRGVRTEEVFTEAAGNYRLFTMNITLENLPVPGGAGGTNYDFRVACRGRNLTSQQISVGKVLNTTHLNQDMAQSSLNLSVLEAW